MADKKRTEGNCGSGSKKPEQNEDHTFDLEENKDPVQSLFDEVNKEVLVEIREKYKDEIRAKLRQKRAAELLLANIDLEIEELRIRISQEM